MRLLVVAGLTLVLLMGAVPLAVPGTPPAVSVALFLVAGFALLGGLVLLARSRRVQGRADVSPVVAAPVMPVPAVAGPAGVTDYVTVRTRW
ncbi:hypothetical protein ACQPX6_05730 [Actinomycetospora sp. CA-101289]|uniref:hypothetical protein n=1 Tax=Actinomycetospora sp. CA-101289 TaxID=3239893 RepID=UPI003D968E36